MNINTHSTISSLQNNTNIQKKTESPSKAAGNLFSTFENMLQEANEQQLNAESKQTEFLTTENKDIHGTMIAMEKAEVSLRLLLQVRNKLTSAYEEVMRMQV